MEDHLKTLQTWVYDTITNSKNIELNTDKWNINSIITPSNSLNSLERINIYRDSYFIRLLECLKHEYPTLVNTLGDELFNHFAQNYLKKYPSTSYTLHDLGKHFPSFLQKSLKDDLQDKKPDTWQLLIIDLAIYERTFMEIFNNEGHELLESNDFFSISPLKLSPAVKVLQLNFPIADYINKSKKKITISTLDPTPTNYVFTRRNYNVSTYKISTEIYNLLKNWIIHPKKLCPLQYQNEWMIKGICYQ